MKSGVAPFVVSCLVMVCVGCGGEAALPFAPVSGVVRLDGEPIPAGTVVFYPSDQEMPVSMGTIEAGGTYTLAAGEAGEGAWIGQHSVAVIPPPPQSFEAAEQVIVPIPEKYQMATTSGIVRDVAEGDNVFDIELVSE